MPENVVKQDTTLLYTETAVAIMDNLHEAGLANAFYDLRKNHDGCTGMWASVALVAIALEDSIGEKWASESRDFMEDMTSIANPLITYSDKIKLIETRTDAEEFVKWFLEGGDHHKG